MLDKIISIMIGIFVFAIISVISLVALSSVSDTLPMNDTSLEEEMFTSMQEFSSFFPVLIVVVVVTVVLGMVLFALSTFGESEPEESEEEIEPKPKEKPHKQTYLEYVKEMEEAKRIIKNG